MWRLAGRSQNGWYVFGRVTPSGNDWWPVSEAWFWGAR